MDIDPKLAGQLHAAVAVLDAARAIARHNDTTVRLTEGKAHQLAYVMDKAADALTLLPALLAVVEAARAYHEAHDAWMRDEIKGLAPTVLNDKEDALFAALSRLGAPDAS